MMHGTVNLCIIGGISHNVTYIQLVFRKKSKCYFPAVDSFPMIEHLTDIPPTYLPLNSDSMC